MLCQECNERKATVHFTKIINGEKTEFHYCEICAQEKGEMFSFNFEPDFTFDNILASLFNFDPALQVVKQSATPKDEILRCSHCGMTFDQFLNISRFGCPHCYETFQKQLIPILRRLHGENVEHQGKIPVRIGGSIYTKKQIKQLKQDLQIAIEKEEFERAAELRDQIRDLENTPFDKGGDE
ncbi:UvrB/UvrC motif-containing protein [Heyndrickxia ginsengihumi]|uniref:UvrB/UvrC motif-containing protein n=1 Tax=Heyndrickxia ginsengihumi TaxID=363870 RepID=UPI0004717D57|nr:UvrB/UvrC motif-containing protein [Heyndrickxia ginsengihumi]